MTAIMTHLFVEASRQWAAASLAPTSQPAAAPVGAAPGTATTTTAAIPDPKTFPTWNQQVNTYEERRLDGKRRVFPAHELLGAEEVLARMWFEHTTSKMYTQVTLGEIVSRRTWTAARTLNPLALSRTTSAANSKALRLEHGNLVPEEPTEWPLLHHRRRGHGIRRLVRDKSNHVPALQAYWQRTSWDLAMALRNNKSFGAAAKLGDHGRCGPMAGSSTIDAGPDQAHREGDPQDRRPPRHGRRHRGGTDRPRRRLRQLGPQASQRWPVPWQRPGGKEQDPDGGKKTEHGGYGGWWSQKGDGKHQQQWWSYGGGGRGGTAEEKRPWKNSTAGRGGGR